MIGKTMRSYLRHMTLDVTEPRKKKNRVWKGESNNNLKLWECRCGRRHLRYPQREHNRIGDTNRCPLCGDEAETR